MKARAITIAVLVLLIQMPIWFWLMYQILVRVNASELMWFLYWVYVPTLFLAGFLGKLNEIEKKSRP